MTLKTYKRNSIPAGMAAPINRIERDYGFAVTTAVVLSGSLIKEWTSLESESELIDVETAERKSIHNQILELERIANYKKPHAGHQKRYFNALKSILEFNLGKISKLIDCKDAHFVGVEREGAILAHEMNLLVPHRSSRIHAKRVHVKGGLMVTLSDISDFSSKKRLVIVDGAIASGSTIISILDQSRATDVVLFSVCATDEGIASISRLASQKGINVSLITGFVEGSLNESYYSCNGPRKVVGDLGDMIARFQT